MAHEDEDDMLGMFPVEEDDPLAEEAPVGAAGALFMSHEAPLDLPQLTDILGDGVTPPLGMDDYSSYRGSDGMGTDPALASEAVEDPMAASAFSEQGDVARLPDSDKKAMKDFLLIRAQERLARSGEFQRRAYELEAGLRSQPPPSPEEDPMGGGMMGGM